MTNKNIPNTWNNPLPSSPQGTPSSITPTPWPTTLISKVRGIKNTCMQQINTFLATLFPHDSKNSTAGYHLSRDTGAVQPTSHNNHAKKTQQSSK